MQSSTKYAIPGVRAHSFRQTSSEARQYKKPKKSNNASFMQDPAKKLSELLDLKGLTPVQKATRITIWHRTEQRKIAGTAAPLRRNLATYLQRNKQCDVYVGQDKHVTITPGEIDQKTGSIVSEVNRVTIWNPTKGTKITGNAAPLPKNLQSYLARHPGTEVYRGQDLIPQHLHDKSKTNSQVSSHVKKHVRKKKSPPRMNNPHATGTVNLTEFEREWMKKGDLPIHMFHETHEPVPESYWTGNAAAEVAKTQGTGPTASPKLTRSPSYCGPNQVENGNTITGPDPHDSWDLDNMSYADLASSWSNTPMWNDPSIQQKIETGGPFVTPIQADRSLVFDESPLDLIQEFYEDTMGFSDNQNSYLNPGPDDVNLTENKYSGGVDLSLSDTFFRNCEVLATKD